MDGHNDRQTKYPLNYTGPLPNKGQHLCCICIPVRYIPPCFFSPEDNRKLVEVCKKFMERFNSDPLHIYCEIGLNSNMDLMPFQLLYKK